MSGQNTNDPNAGKPQAVPADQRMQGPSETQIIPPADPNSHALKTAGEPVALRGSPCLRGESAPLQGRLCELIHEKTFIGRANTNDLVIDDDTVSAQHAQIVREQDTWRVINLISTNGTRVNGQDKVVSYLAPGDLITFGSVAFRFEGDVAAEPTAPGRPKRVRAAVALAVAVGLTVTIAAALILTG